MTEEREYNLLEEKWIRVMNADGSVSSVSLPEAFGKAHEIRSISGDSPPQDLAVLRLMLAVMYAAYPHADLADEREAADAWHSMWEKGRFDGTAREYLSKWKDRFYLFDPERPFYQAPIDKGTEYTAAKLDGNISESNNKARLFLPVSPRNKGHMGYAEAARWLLYLNGFDDTSAKPTVRGGENKLPSSGAGWMGKLGLVYAEGSTLFETLMLNFVLSSEGRPFPRGKPVWELERPRCEERVEIPLPSSPEEMLTLQSRRTLLGRDGEGVTGFLLMGGDIVDKENAFTEQMTVWRLDKTSKQWVPKRHDPSKAMWRDYASLLVSSKSNTEDAQYREPGVVMWLSVLSDRGYLEPGSVTLRVTGVKYADKDFFVEDIIDDGMSVNRGLLSSVGEVWNIRISEIISKTETCAYAVGDLAKKIVGTGANSGDETLMKGIAANARADFYYSLDQPFRVWLSGIDPENDDIEEKMAEWLETLRRRSLSAGRDALRGLGASALVKGKLDSNPFVSYRMFAGLIRKTTATAVTEGDGNGKQ